MFSQVEATKAISRLDDPQVYVPWRVLFLRSSTLGKPPACLWISFPELSKMIKVGVIWTRNSWAIFFPIASRILILRTVASPSRSRSSPSTAGLLDMQSSQRSEYTCTNVGLPSSNCAAMVPVSNSVSVGFNAK